MEILVRELYLQTFYIWEGYLCWPMQKICRAKIRVFDDLLLLKNYILDLVFSSIPDVYPKYTLRQTQTRLNLGVRIP